MAGTHLFSSQLSQCWLLLFAFLFPQLLHTRISSLLVCLFRNSSSQSGSIESPGLGSGFWIRVKLPPASKNILFTCRRCFNPEERSSATNLSLVILEVSMLSSCIAPSLTKTV